MDEDKVKWFQPNKNLNDTQKLMVENCYEAFIEFAKIMQDTLPDGRRKAMVFSKLEEAAAMATKTITHG